MNTSTEVKANIDNKSYSDSNNCGLNHLDKIFNDYCEENDKFYYSFFITKLSSDDLETESIDKLTFNEFNEFHLIENDYRKKIIKLILNLKKRRNLVTETVKREIDDYNCTTIDYSGEMNNFQIYRDERGDFDFKKFFYAEYIGFCPQKYFDTMNQIKNIPNYLNRLRITSKNITKIENINYLKCLKKLYLEGNKINKIENIEKLTQLEKLKLDNNKIVKIENMDNLINLKRLNLNNNKIVILENFGSLINLKHLKLEYNKIRKIQNLDKLTNLKLLYLNNNQIEEIENIDNLINLEILRLNYNKIQKIEKIEKNKKLEMLFINYNKITTLPEATIFEPLCHFSHLNLEYNHIIKITDKKYFDYLQFSILLGGNPVSYDPNIINKIGRKKEIN